MHVTFHREFKWAIFPTKDSIEITDYDDRKLYEENFRWIRQNRKKEFCLPWRLGHELGWYLHSPIDVTLYPIDDCELYLNTEELEATHKFLGLNNIWKREQSFISVANDWMKLYQFKGQNDTWETMFIPNGSSTAEWRQGISLVMPAGYSMLISPLENDPGIGIHYGMLLQKSNVTMNDIGGLSIAIKPMKCVKLKRGQPIARLIPISNEAIKMTCEYSDNV